MQRSPPHLQGSPPPAQSQRRGKGITSCKWGLEPWKPPQMKAARPKQWALSAWLRAELASLSKNGGEGFSQQAAPLSPHSRKIGPGIVLHSIALHPSFKMRSPSRLPFGPPGALGGKARAALH